jgi:signal transduction histidine kinase
MVTGRWFPSRQTLQRLLLGILEIAGISALVWLLRPVVPAFSLAALYVLPILQIATWSGFWPALLMAVAATLTFDFLFVRPSVAPSVRDAGSATTLVVFAVTAYVVSALAGRARRRALEAESLARDIQAAEHKVRRFADEQAALRRVATLVAGGATPAETFGLVAGEVGQLFGADVAVVFRFEPDRTGTVVGLWSVPGVDFPGRAQLAVEGVGVAVTVRDTGRPAQSGRFEGPPGSIAACFEQIGARSGVGAPITVEGRLWGAVVAASTEVRKLPVGSEAGIGDFTALAGTALSNADARSALRRVAEEQAALRHVAVLVARAAPAEEVFATVTAEVGRVLDADFTSMSRYDPDGSATVVGTWSKTGTALRVPAGGRLERGGRNLHTCVFQTGRPARIDDYADATGSVAGAARDRGFRSSVGVPISVEGRVWGVVSVGSTRERSMPADTEARLSGFTELVATALANAEARVALTASRARIVATADSTRQRIERDLHDGAQQRLVSLALQLRAARAAVPPALEDLAGSLDSVAGELTGALDELREMARGIHPAVLAQGGLRPALKALARRSPVPVRLEVRVDERQREPIEMATYFVVSEALTNAAKHAEANVVDVEIDLRDGILGVRVRDDGRGGADFGRGSGLVGLKDRVEALGGRLSVQSPPGAGTSVLVELPVGEGRPVPV